MDQQAYFAASPEEKARMREQALRLRAWKAKGSPNYVESQDPWGVGITGASNYVEQMPEAPPGAPITPFWDKPSTKPAPIPSYDVVGDVPPPSPVSAPAAATSPSLPAADGSSPASAAYQPQPGQPWDPTLVAGLGALGTMDERGADLSKEADKWDRWAETPMPEGRTAGRVFVAANPLETMGALVRTWRGAKEGKDTRKALEKQRAEVDKIRKTMINKVLGIPDEDNLPDWAKEENYAKF